MKTTAPSSAMLIIEVFFSVAFGIAIGYWTIDATVSSSMPDELKPYMLVFYWVAGVWFFLSHLCAEKRTSQSER